MNKTSNKKETCKCGEAKKDGSVDARAAMEKAFKEMLESPLSEEEAKKMLADNEVQLSQLAVVRTKIVGELNNIDQQIASARFEQQIIYRRTLNKKADK